MPAIKTPIEKPPLFRKTDILVLLAVLSCLLLTWLIIFLPTKQETASDVTLRVDGQIHRTFSLTENTEFTVENNGHTLTFKIENRTAKVTDSTCKDKICQRAGVLKNAGDTAVCLPANISVALEDTSAPDGITY